MPLPERDRSQDKSRNRTVAGWYVEDAYSNYYGPFKSEQAAWSFSNLGEKDVELTGLHGNTCANYFEP